MSKQEKIDKRALVFNPIVFVERQLYREQTKHRVFKTIFIVINLLIFLSTLAIGVLTPMVIGKFFGAKADTTWYYFVLGFIGAGTALGGSLINFLFVKRRYEVALKHYHIIQKEIILYASGSDVYENSSIDKDLLLFDRVTRKIEYGQEEESNE